MTEIGLEVLQTRLSLRETQGEFGARFRVNGITVHRWETGKVAKVRNIYQEILAGLRTNLRAKGQLLPKEVVAIFFRESADVV